MPRLSLRRDRRGVTAVEFALIAPVMITLICGTIEFGHFFMEQTSLEGALLEAARSASAAQEQSQDDRDLAMRAKVTTAMSEYRVANGQQLTIDTAVYGDFSSASPEPFRDLNGNGVYDPPQGANAGEPFTDRNGNGKWDAAVPKAGKAGDPGDVVSYTAVFPAEYLFGFISSMTGRPFIRLKAPVVTRDEPVKTIGSPAPSAAAES